MNVAAELRVARHAAGLSQAELARRAGTSQPAVARYESGGAVPGLATLERLLAACGRRLEVTAGEPEKLHVALVRERPRLLTLARRHGVTTVRLFGSTARGEAGPDSDVDLLVELEPGRTLLDLIAFRREAGELLGRSVDVATLEMLRVPVRREVERDAVAL